jgi:hypothetical protein
MVNQPSNKKSAEYSADFYDIKSQLTHVYPDWRSKLGYFFPFAPIELVKNPIPEMILLLADAFNIEVSKKDKEELKRQIQQALMESDAEKEQQRQQSKEQSSKQGEGQESKQGEGQESKQGEGQEPKQGEGQEPKQGEGQEPKQGEGQEPKQGEGQEPKQGEGQEPKQGEGQEPKQGEGQEPKQGEGQEPKQGEGQEPKQGEGQEPKQGEGQEPKQGEGQEPKQGEGQEPKQGEGQSSASSQSSSGPQTSNKSSEELRREFLESFASSRTDELDQIKNMSGIPKRSSRQITTAEPTIDIALSNLFKKRLVAESRTKAKHNLEEGELDSHELIGAVSGRRDVFNQYSRGKANKISFVLCLDASSSMRGGRCRRQAEAAVNIVSALDRIKIPVCILTFGGSVAYTRPFGDTSSLKISPTATSGSTNTRLCYSRALDVLLTRPEKRRIMMIVTDGRLIPGNCSTLYKKAQQNRIESYGFAIDDFIDPHDHDHAEYYGRGYDRAVGYTPDKCYGTLQENLYNYMDDLFQTPIY